MANVKVDRQSRLRTLLLSISKPRTRNYVIQVCIGELKLCTACLHETSGRDKKVRDPRRDAETFWAETETRPRGWALCPRRDRDETLVRLETVSRPRRRDRDHIPAKEKSGSSQIANLFVPSTQAFSEPRPVFFSLHGMVSISNITYISKSTPAHIAMLCKQLNPSKTVNNRQAYWWSLFLCYAIQNINLLEKFSHECTFLYLIIVSRC